MPRMRRLLISFLSIFLAVELYSPASAQTLSALAEFDGTNGSFPAFVSLIQGTDGNFYGTTMGGGTSKACQGGCGTVFKVTPEGVLTAFVSFDSTNDESPYAGVFQASDGNFYGTTYGDSGEGTLFQLTPAGEVTTLANNLYSFGAPIEASDQSLYGASANGGANGDGGVFKISPSGTVSTIYSFGSYSYSNQVPYGPAGGLIQATDGNFYGTTKFGGTGGDLSSCSADCGTVFQLTPAGKLTVIHNFCSASSCDDGYYPIGALLQASDGNLYGTTSAGGADGNGTVFRITPNGELKTLHAFCSEPNCSDGAGPYGPLIQATDGNLYGTTNNGGLYEDSYGTIYQLTLSGVLTTIADFSLRNGQNPEAGLLQSTNGMFYGVTFTGGDNGQGVVYSLDMGLGPFIATNPTAGNVGIPVIILGNNLTSASRVTFNGEAAEFTVVSGTEIKAKVPSGATTGPVEVVTSSTTLKSNTAFRVTK
jgi:uncharacterized repeat protein (TIGR03803 family)